MIFVSKLFFDPLGFFDDDRGQRTIGRTFFDRGDLVHDIHTLDDLAERGILAIEPRVIRVADEELAARGIRVAGTGHRDGSAHVRSLVVHAVRAEFALDVVAGAAGPGAKGAPALDHEALDDAMEGQSVIEAFLHELLEILGADGRVFMVRLDFDLAEALDG